VRLRYRSAARKPQTRAQIGQRFTLKLAEPKVKSCKQAILVIEWPAESIRARSSLRRYDADDLVETVGVHRLHGVANCGALDCGPRMGDTRREWIPECAKQKWVILSGDKTIEEVPAERQAVIDGKRRVFMLDDTTSKSDEWLAAILVGRRRLLHLAQNADGPFFVTIRKFGYSHFALPGFIQGTGAGWRPAQKDLKPPELVQQTRKKGSVKPADL
jgi:hypothetical protein